MENVAEDTKCQLASPLSRHSQWQQSKVCLVVLTQMHLRGRHAFAAAGNYRDDVITAFEKLAVQAFLTM